MGRRFATLTKALRGWIDRQPLFFVATAPNDPSGHVNMSPKGAMETFRILGPTTVAYIDLVGSGIETVAHLRENGRIVIMFCAFEGAPKILRLHGQGRVVFPDDSEFASLWTAFSPREEVADTTRSIVVVEVARITDSCGFVVPRMTYEGQRALLFKWAASEEKQFGPEWKPQFLLANNVASIDGLQGVDETATLTEEQREASSSVGKAL